MRDAIRSLAKLGPAPAECDAEYSKVLPYEELLRIIEPPVTDEEARILVGVFGPDTFFGLAWTLIHLIETAPSWPIDECLIGDTWGAELLRTSVTNSRLKRQ